MSGYDHLRRGQALFDAGEIAGAVEAFKAAAESGIAQGYIELANVEIERGDRQAARAWIQKAEVLAEQGDALAGLSCSVAHQMGYGGGTFEEEEQKARYFLRKAAELGNPVAQSMLAQHLLWGLNGEEKNEEEYEVWIHRAIEQDLDEAIITHIQNRRHFKRDIEPGVTKKLEELATRSKEARTLLREVTGSKGATRSSGSPDKAGSR